MSASLLVASSGASEAVTATLQTVLALVVLVLSIMGAVKTLKHRYWGPRIKAIFRRPLVVIATVIGGLMVLTAWLDSVRWIDQHEAGANVPLEATKAQSLFDRIYSVAVGTPWYEYRERSYSAPLAETESMDEDIKLDHKHLLGTGQTGEDTLYRVLKGCRPAVMIGTVPLLIAIPLALLGGIAAGYFRGRVDDIVVYLYNTLASIPSLLLLIALVTALGHGFAQIAVGLGVTGAVGLCRLVRGETLKLRELEYVQAAKCLGVGDLTIIMKHILPNLMHIVLITAILSFTGLVLSESILSYLGLGLEHSWGAMIDHARDEISREPPITWNLLASSVALFMLVFSINVIGDAIRDALDPRISLEGDA